MQEVDVAGYAPDCLDIWSVPGTSWHSFQDVLKAPFKPYKVGTPFGPSWTVHWFRLQLHLPESCPTPRGAPLLIRWVSNCESLLWTEDGRPLCGLSVGRTEAVIDDAIRGGKDYLVYVEMVCNPTCNPALDGCPHPDVYHCFALTDAMAVVPNILVRQVMADFHLLAGTAKSMPGTAVGAVAHETALQMRRAYRRGQPSSWCEARRLACRLIGQRGASCWHKGYAVGHCHMTIGGRCPLQEVRRRTARCFSAQLHLLQQFPEHHFVASQAWLFEQLLNDYPGLFAHVLAAINGQDTATTAAGGGPRAGRFLPVGGSYVEMDMNMPNGESLVRQLLLGQRIFQQLMGQRCDIFWCCGASGLAAQFPQLLLGSGINCFVGSLRGSDDHLTTFKWTGLHGSCVLAHILPDSMHSQASVGDIMASVHRNKQKGTVPSTLMVFGNNNGGQGPTVPMARSLERLADPQGLGIDGILRMTQSTPAIFFKSLESVMDEIPAWAGEMLPPCSSRYTHHAVLKANNRACETLLHDVEMLGVLASSLGDHEYPFVDILDIWKDVLLFQSPGIIAGSSVPKVFWDAVSRFSVMTESLVHIRGQLLWALSRELFGAQGEHKICCVSETLDEPSEYAEAEGKAVQAEEEDRGAVDISECLEGFVLVDAQSRNKKQTDDASSSRSSSSSSSSSNDGIVHGSGNAPWFFNSLAFERCEVIEVDGPLPPECQTMQKSCQGLPLLTVTCKPLSFTQAVNKIPSVPVEVASFKSGADRQAFVMKNAFIEAKFNDSGMLASLLDLASKRELVPPGRQGNMLKMSEVDILDGGIFSRSPYECYQGCPGSSWNAVGKRALLEVVESGPLRACLKLTVDCQGSTSSLQQLVFLHAFSPRITFTTTVKWCEPSQALWVEFPWDLQASHAWYEVQFGAVPRPTDASSTSGLPKNEMCAHRWSDLSDGTDGMALLNDSKYGHATRGSTQILSLISPSADGTDEADLGVHKFSYALLPHHDGGWQANDVVAHAAAFNYPLLQLPYEQHKVPKLSSFADTPFFAVLSDGSSSLVLDTIKLAEPSSAPLAGRPPIIARLYETKGLRGMARLHVNEHLGKVSKAVMCNILEDESDELRVIDADGNGACVELTFSSWQILSLKVLFK